MLWISPIIVALSVLDVAVSTPGKTHPDHGVPIDEHPHHVFIEAHPWKCSGAIISPQYVVTTASCALEMRRPYNFVRSNSSVWGKNGTQHRITDVTIHEDHQLLENGNSINDIALIKVNETFETRQVIDILGGRETIQLEKPVTITGVGENENRDGLLAMQASILPVSKCALDARSRNQFCMKYSGQPRMGASNDDFGDLAVGRDEKRGKRLVGIHSWDKLGPMYEDEPVAVYTSIAHHYNWILKKIGIKPN